MVDDTKLLLVCEHCHYTVTSGEKVVVGTKGVVHDNCFSEYRQAMDGYPYRCPKCSHIGEIDHPQGRTVLKNVPCGPGEVPDCAYNGCRGCPMCRDNLKVIEVPIRVKCDLCDGRGYLATKPEEIVGIVGWRT